MDDGAGVVCSVKEWVLMQILKLIFLAKVLVDPNQFSLNHQLQWTYLNGKEIKSSQKELTLGDQLIQQMDLLKPLRKMLSMIISDFSISKWETLVQKSLYVIRHSNEMMQITHKPGIILVRELCIVLWRGNLRYQEKIIWEQNKKQL